MGKIIKNGKTISGTPTDSKELIANSGNTVYEELNNKASDRVKVNGQALSSNPILDGTISTSIDGKSTVNEAIASFSQLKKFNMIGVAAGASFYTNQCWYNPMNGRVDIFFDMSLNSTSTNTTICRVPEAYKPKEQLANNGITWINTTPGCPGYVVMRTDGTVTQSASSGATRVAASFVYYTDKYK